MEIKLEYI